MIFNAQHFDELNEHIQIRKVGRYSLVASAINDRGSLLCYVRKENGYEGVALAQFIAAETDEGWKRGSMTLFACNYQQREQACTAADRVWNAVTCTGLERAARRALEQLEAA